MLNFGLFLLTAILASDKACAAGVTGAAEGFAKGVTGGGSATPVYPSTNAELVSCKYKPSPTLSLLLSLKFFRYSSMQHFKVGSALIHSRPWRLFCACDHSHKDF